MKYKLSKSVDNSVKMLVDDKLINFLEKHYAVTGLEEEPARVLSHLPGNTELFIAGTLGSSDVETSHCSYIDRSINDIAVCGISDDNSNAFMCIKRSNLFDDTVFTFREDDKIGEIILVVDYNEPVKDCSINVSIYPIVLKESDIGTVKIVKSIEDKNLYLVDKGGVVDISNFSHIADYDPEKYEEI